MTNQHPITVPIGSITFWKISYRATCQDDLSETEYIATQAAQWGADQELEACCDWLDVQETRSPQWFDLRHDACALVSDLRAARRPKPPSLRKQAYDALDTYIYGEPDPKDKERTYNTIRKALEALPND